MRMTAAEVALLVGGAVEGDPEVMVSGIHGIRHARPGDVTFLADTRYLPWLERTAAPVVLAPADLPACPGKTLIRVANPYEAFAKVVDRFRPCLQRPLQGIHPTAVVGANVQLGEGVALGPHAVVSDDTTLGPRVALHAGVYVGYACTIGADTIVYPNATIREEVVVGARCIIHSGAVIGSDGFGFVKEGTGLRKIPQVGTVVLGDDVEVGANSAIDRARFGETVVGRGTKIDNLVQIGHNTEIGEDCILCGNVGVAGSAVLGNRVTLAAGSGVNGHVEVGDDVTVAALSGVTKSIPAGSVVSGYPATEHHRDKRIVASVRMLPETMRRLRELESRLRQLESLLNGNAEDHR